MNRRLVFTVGNEMMGDDGAGPLLAHMLERVPVDGWAVLDGSNTPENLIYKVRELAPEQVVVVDAADMELEAGEVRHIDRETIGSLFLMTTHSLPLGFLIDSIAESVSSVELIGIQPQAVAFGYPISSAVKDGVKRVYQWLASGADFAGLVKPM